MIREGGVVATPPVPGQTPSSPQAGATPDSAELEISALSRLRVYGMLTLLSVAVGWAASILSFSAALGPDLASAAAAESGATGLATFSSASLGAMFRYLGAVGSASVAIELASLVFLRQALRQLSKVDSARFSTPTTFTLVAIIGFLVFIPGFVAFFGSLGSVVVDTPPGASPPADAYVYILAVIALWGVGGILAAIGLVGGVILGLWRVGSKYERGFLKAAAVFTIIPLLNIVGAIILVVTAGEIRSLLVAYR